MASTINGNYGLVEIIQINENINTEWKAELLIGLRQKDGNGQLFFESYYLTIDEINKLKEAFNSINTDEIE